MLPALRKTTERLLGALGRFVPILALCLPVLTLFCAPGKSLARPMSLAELAETMLHVTPVPMPGAISALYRPIFDTVYESELKLSPSEIVFVAMLPEGPRIYPQQYLVWHQVINELVDDHAYAMTYCPITGTLACYDARIEGVNLIFDVEGHETQDGFFTFLYDGNTIMVDRNTGSLWLQETGMAFDGPMLGRGMATLPVYWTTWNQAKKVFPDAPVMARPRGMRPYGRDPYGSYDRKDSYYHNDDLAYPVRRTDRRLPRKTPMLGLELDNYLLAVDIEYVKEKGAVNFFMGRYPLLAVFDPVLGVVRIYDRQVWAEPFLFVLRNGRLTDLTSHTVWDPSTGMAIEGNLKGAEMRQYFGIYTMWFAWYSINPETLVIPGPGEVDEALLTTRPPGMDEKGNYEDPPKPRDSLPGSPTW